MRAAVVERYGPPEVVEIRELPTPAPADDEVLVRVHASSLNQAEWYTVAGRPYVGRPLLGLTRPRSDRLGVDFAGTVADVGGNVSGFRPGDEVFGGRSGAWADYVCVRHDRAIVRKPPNASFEEAATLGVAGLTALQGLRDKGGLQPGQRVLVNGASGGVGTFAIQVAKALGAEVTAVCSTQNVETARSLGADHVVDYTHEDFTRGGRRYDVLFDVAGSRSWRECTRVLAPHATVVLAGGSKSSKALGPLGHVLAMGLSSLPSRRKTAFFIAKFERPDVEVLGEWLADGKLTPFVERRFALDDVAAALRAFGEGHNRGKTVLTMVP